MCCRNWPGRKDFAALGLEIAMSTSLRRGAREQQIGDAEAQPSVSKSIGQNRPDELKEAIILFFSLLDERERRVYAGRISQVRYGGDRCGKDGLDVSTVARGRRELLEHDVNSGSEKRVPAASCRALWIEALAIPSAV